MTNKNVRVNVRSKVAGKVSRTQREGRETLILPSYAAKADTVLNNIFYPKEELEASYASLNRTPAPYGHPTLGGQFVPAKDPEAMARTSIFAWNENARWDGDRIALDVVIDEARAKESENGRKFLDAVNGGKPISTSTGLLCSLEVAENKPYESIARGIEFDHCAILLDEAPAIAPEQGVGIFVNAAGKSEEVEVINSTLEKQADEEIGYAAQRLAQAIDRKQRASGVDSLLEKILQAIGLKSATPQTNESEDTMAGENQNNDLSERVDALSVEVSNIGETIANAVTAALKPVLDAQAEITANAKAKDEAELAVHVAAIVKANILDEESAKELTLNAARKLAEKAKPGKAAALNGALGDTEAKGEFDDYDLNAGMEVSK